MRPKPANNASLLLTSPHLTPGDQKAKQTSTNPSKSLPTERERERKACKARSQKCTCSLRRPPISTGQQPPANIFFNSGRSEEIDTESLTRPRDHRQRASTSPAGRPRLPPEPSCATPAPALSPRRRSFRPRSPRSRIPPTCSTPWTAMRTTATTPAAHWLSPRYTPSAVHVDVHIL
jgi:hypothetical protein